MAVVDDVHNWKTPSNLNGNKKQATVHSLQKLGSGFSSHVLKLLNQHDGELGGGVDSDDDAADARKPKQQENPEVVNVADAAAKIHRSALAAFLAIIDSNESHQDIQLAQFTDYFERVFASTQFQWMKIFRESSFGEMVHIPIAHISRPIYKTSVNWLSKISSKEIGSFVLRSLNSILSDTAVNQKAVKGSKEVVHEQLPKSQVAIFVVLAMVLRQKPEVLISLLPEMRQDPKYQGQDKLPLTIWLIVQACEGNLIVGLFMWVHLLLPMLSTTKSSSNPQSTDLILQLVESILSAPDARFILLNGVVFKGERVVPPWALELLMRLTFPEHSARVEATERFETVYPTLKEVALAGSPGNKAMKQITRQILQFSIKAVGEGIPDLSKEASNLFIWCLTQNVDCYKQWDNLYLDNLEASVVVLRKLSDEWKEHSVKHSTLQSLKAALKSFSQKNMKALAMEGKVGHQAREAEKYCKFISKRLSWGCGCINSMAFVYLALAAGAAIIYQNIHLS